jgi:hypothetical protein
MKTLSDLNEKQAEYIKEHALELFAATMLPPSDNVKDIMESTCFCCSGRRDFVKRLMKIQ